MSGINAILTDFCLQNDRGLAAIGQNFACVGDSKGNLWFTQPQSNQIVKVVITGNASLTFQVLTFSTGANTQPTGICFADAALATEPFQVLAGTTPGQNPVPPPAPAQIWVTCPGNNTIQGYSLDGTLQMVIGDAGTGLPVSVPAGQQQATAARGAAITGGLYNIRAMIYPQTNNWALVATEKNSSNLCVITDDQTFVDFNTVGNNKQWKMASPKITQLAIPGLTPATQGTQGLAIVGAFVWFAETKNNLLGTVQLGGNYAAPSGPFQTFTFPTVLGPTELAADKNGNVWFLEPGVQGPPVIQKNEVGFININGNTGVFPVPPPPQFTGATYALNGIGLGADGNMWFTMGNANYIGVVGTNTTNQSASFAFIQLQQDQMNPQLVAPSPTLLSNNTSVLPFGSTSTNGSALGVMQTLSTLGQRAISTVTVVPTFNGTQAALGPLSPSGIALGTDNNFYVTDFFSNKIDVYGPPAVQPAGSVQGGTNIGSTRINQFGLPPGAPTGNPVAPNAAFLPPTATDKRPVAICLGGDGNLWFTEQANSAANGNAIGKMTNGGTITEFVIPTADSRPTGICAGPVGSGNVYFVENASSKIGVISTATGGIVEINTPTAGSSPQFICLGPDGNIWFTESAGAGNGLNPQIGKLNVQTNIITEFGGLTANGVAFGICAGPDGNVWFTETNGNKIGRITPTGAVTEFTIPTAQSGASQIITGADKNLWFSELTANQMGGFNPNNPAGQQFLELPNQTVGPGNFGMVSLPATQSPFFPKGFILFTETNRDKLGCLQLLSP